MQFDCQTLYIKNIIKISMYRLCMNGKHNFFKELFKKRKIATWNLFKEGMKMFRKQTANLFLNHHTDLNSDLSQLTTGSPCLLIVLPPHLVYDFQTWQTAPLLYLSSLTSVSLRFSSSLVISGAYCSWHVRQQENWQV